MLLTVGSDGAVVVAGAGAGGSIVAVRVSPALAVWCGWRGAGLGGVEGQGVPLYSGQTLDFEAPKFHRYGKVGTRDLALKSLVNCNSRGN